MHEFWKRHSLVWAWLLLPLLLLALLLARSTWPLAAPVQVSPTRVAASTTSSPAPQPTIQPSPLTLQQVDGTAVTLSDLALYPLIAVFISADDIAPLGDIGELWQAAQCTADAGGRLAVIGVPGKDIAYADSFFSSLTEMGIDVQAFWDLDGRASQACGIDSFPSVAVFLGSESPVSLTQGQTITPNDVNSLLSEALEGRTSYLFRRIREVFSAADGGMRTNYVGGLEDSVLSESQGLLMLYAATAGDQAAFDSAWGYAQTMRTDAGLTAWIVSGAEPGQANAAVDDLRIIAALLKANELWGGYEQAIAHLEDALYLYNTENGHLIDFYEWQYNQKAMRFTLCYADFPTLQKLALRDERWTEVYENALQTVLAGRISDDFPLYYSWYDREAGGYAGERMQMAEALLTLYHLACIDALPHDAYQWVKNMLEQGALYAWYTPEGLPTGDGLYESTAVYALSAMIAHELGDADMESLALRRMERLRIRDESGPVAGLYGNADGAGVYSFDQLTALLALTEVAYPQ